MQTWTLVEAVKKNPLFKFTSSVKLAVPLMLVLGGVVAYGTVLESLYNSDYAKLEIYNSWWFLLLQALLFVNILNSTLSRLPWKRRHLGFVITHLGLLTLLTGAFITAEYGVDGSLRVREGESASTVFLPRLMFGYQLEGAPRAQSVTFDKVLKERSGSQLEFMNATLGHVVRGERLLPFARVNRVFAAGAGSGDEVGVSFRLKSQFFNVSEWLHTRETPTLSMGPATLKISRGQPKPARRVAAAVAKPKTRGDTVTIKKDGAVVATWDLSKPSFRYDNVQFKLTRKLARAVVADNRLVEGDADHPANAALELEVSSGGQTLREVLFAKFPGFTLNKAGVFGLGIELNSTGADEVAPVADGGSGPLIEFFADESAPRAVKVQLSKAGQVIKSAELKEGDVLSTPWMGMELSLATISWGAGSTYEAEPTRPKRGQELPPSAILVKPQGQAEPFWLQENDQRDVEWGGRKARVFFGREFTELPFAIKLLKFSKVDYPGTETPMSFSSDVDTGDGRAQTISMNEPLKKDGYTIYQASYVMNASGPPDSIFSVNRDPGRPVKYGGSLILACGIVLFTVTRSRWYTRRFGPL